MIMRCLMVILIDPVLERCLSLSPAFPSVHLMISHPFHLDSIELAARPSVSLARAHQPQRALLLVSTFVIAVDCCEMVGVFDDGVFC